MSRHHNSKHKVVIPEHKKSNRLDDSEPYTHNIVDTGTVNNSDNLDMIPYDDKKVVYDRIESKNYFGIHESSTKSHRGPAYLVGMAVCQTSTAHKLLNDYDILLHLLIAKFAVSLTRGQRVEFGFILNLIQEKLTGQTKKDKNSSESSDRNRTATQTQEETKYSIVARIPNSDSDLMRWYIDGSYSILKNLLYPKVSLFKNNSYV